MRQIRPPRPSLAQVERESDWWRRVVSRIRGRNAPSLSVLLQPPAWSEYPLPKHVGNELAWYVLFVPTCEEGFKVRSELTRVLAQQKADFTVLVGFPDDDPTAEDIDAAARMDDRILPVRTGPPGSELDKIISKLNDKLLRIEEGRQRQASDVTIVSMSQLILRGKQYPPARRAPDGF